MNLRTKLLAAVGALGIAALAAQAQVPGVNSTLNSVFTLAYDNSTMKPTYSASAGFYPTGTTATDVCSLSGSATKTIKVRRVLITAMATTAASDPIAVLRRSTASVSGTAAIIPVPVAYDSNNSAATAFADLYIANPTLGTLVGVLADPYFSIGNLTTGGAMNPTPQVIFGQLGSPVVLRGVLETVAVNLNSGSYSGIQMSCTFEWTEE